MRTVTSSLPSRDGSHTPGTTSGSTGIPDGFKMCTLKTVNVSPLPGGTPFGIERGKRSNGAVGTGTAEPGDIASRGAFRS